MVLVRQQSFVLKAPIVPSNIDLKEALNRNDEKVRFHFFYSQQDVASQQIKSKNHILLMGLLEILLKEEFYPLAEV